MRNRRYIALFLLTLFTIDVFLPLGLHAHSPSVGNHYSGFSQGSGVNVSKVNGALNVSIPITSIPEYGQSISYVSGQNITQDAGVFGFGFSGFSGAINRTVNGIPDDINGGKIHSLFRNQILTDIGVVNQGGVAIPLPTIPPISLSAGRTWGGGFNNYEGRYFILGRSAGIGIGLGDIASVGVNASLLLDSREDGAAVSVGIGGGVGFGGVGIGGGYGVTYKDNGGGTSQYAGMGVSVLGWSPWTSGNLLGNESFSSSGSVNSSLYLPNLYSLNPSATSTGASKEFSVPLGFVNYTRIGTSMRSVFGMGLFKKEVFGSYYLKNYERDNGDHMADFTIEGEQKPEKAISYMQKDIFSISSSGLAGNFEVVQSEVGIFSRNTVRARTNFSKSGGPLGFNWRPEVNYTSESTFPWLGAGNIKINKNPDVINALLSNDRRPSYALAREGNEIEEVFFNHVEQVSFVGDYDAFGDSYFRMRGDFSGDYRFNNSTASKDFPLEIRYEKTPFHYEKNKFHYGTSHQVGYPVIGNQNSVNEFENKLRNAEIKRSTVIREIKVAEYINETEDLPNIDQSIYSHYKLQHKANAFSLADNAVNDGDVLTRLSVTAHLEEILAQEEAAEDPEVDGNYFNDVIAGFEVIATNGVKYYYTLPVFSYGEKEYGLKGDGHVPPVLDGDRYKTTPSYTRGGKEVSKAFYYPKTWLLTAVVQPDYIDRDDIPGPSDGDLGNWVRFNYIQTQDQYRWRMPLVGLHHSVGALHDKSDDYYSCSTGNKEIYVLGSIESSGFEAIYSYALREDGYGAKGEIANGAAWNTFSHPNGAKLGPHASPVPFLDANKFSVCVTDVTLYNKVAPSFFGQFFSLGASHKNKNRIPISGTAFKYDYSLGEKLLSNINYTNPNATVPSYLANEDSYFYKGETAVRIGNGHLTLREVIPYTYDEKGNKHKQPSYEFMYEDAEDNFAFSPGDKEVHPKQLDQWGNPNPTAGKPAESGDPCCPSSNHLFYSPYGTLSKEKADKNANLFQLQKMKTPLGGEQRFHYEAGSYQSVQDKAPQVMRNIVSTTVFGNTVDKSQGIEVTVDISDIIEYYERLENEGIDPESLGLSPEPTIADCFRPTRVSPGKKPSDQKDVYVEYAFYRNAKAPSEIAKANSQQTGLAVFGDDQVKVTNYGVVDYENKTQKVRLRTTWTEGPLEKIYPVLNKFRTWMYASSEEMSAVKGGGNEIPDSREALPPPGEDVKRALKKMAKQLKDLLRDSEYNYRRFDEIYGEVYTNRFDDSKVFNALSYLRTPALVGKYTGTRVAAIVSTPNFNFATNGIQEQPYVTHYYYDTQGDGTGVTTGVASNEIGFGKDLVFDPVKSRGKGFYAAPRIIYGKVTEKVEVPEADAAGLADGKAYRPTGKVEVTHLTPDKLGYRFEDNFTTDKENAVPFAAISTLKYDRLVGRVPKRVRLGGRSTRRVKRKVGIRYTNTKFTNTTTARYVDVADYYGKETSKTVYDRNGDIVLRVETHYKDPKALVNVADAGFDDLRTLRPGAFEQVWGEMSYKQSKKGTVRKRRSDLTTTNNYQLVYTNYMYVPPLVDKVITFKDGVKNTTEHLTYDAYTLNPVTSKSTVGTNTYFRKVRPAYWNNTAMRPAATFGRTLNRLTETDYEVSYKGAPNNNNVLAASATEYAGWSPSGGTYSIADSWVMEQVKIGSQYIYQPAPYNFQDAYYNQSGSGLMPPLRNVIKPAKSYQLFSDVNTEGFISDFENKQFPGDHRDWKVVNEITTFDHKGNPLESVDRQGNYTGRYFYPGTSLPQLSVMQAKRDLTAFSSGEYVFSNPIEGAQALTNSNFYLLESVPAKTCSAESSIIKTTLSLSDYLVGPGDYEAYQCIVDINEPFQHDIPVCKLKIYYTLPNIGDVSVDVTVMISADGQLYMVNNDGSSFDVFFSSPLNDGRTRAYFPPFIHQIDLLAEYSSSKISSGFIRGGSGEIVTANILPSFRNCTTGEKEISIPTSSCLAKWHSGMAGFKLPSDSRGCGFIMPTILYQAMKSTNEFMVSAWISNLVSPESIQAVCAVRPINADLDFSEEIILQEHELLVNELPYSGNWRWLKHTFNFEIPVEYRTEDYELVVYLRNDSDTDYYIDDVLFKPAATTTNASVYEHKLLRSSAQINSNNFAVFKYYDALGRERIKAADFENVSEEQKIISKSHYGFQKEED